MEPTAPLLKKAALTASSGVKATLPSGTVSSADADAINYLKFFTFLSHAEISALEKSLQTQPEKREAQIRLAQELTQMIHGEIGVKQAVAASTALFGEGIKSLDEATLLDVLQGAPVTKKELATLKGGGMALLDLLVDTTLCASKGAAKKEVAAGGIYLNNARISDPQCLVTVNDCLAGAHLLLRKGKKTYHLVKFA